MKILRPASLPAFVSLSLFGSLLSLAQAKQPITLDEFMNTSEIRDARISPDGSAAVICIGAPDWQHNRFKEDLWLWTKQGGALHQLTYTGHDSSPLWSPDGRYVAFLSDRSFGEASEGKDDDEKDAPSRVWIIPVDGGEAFPLYTENLDAHAFAWSADGKAIDFSVQQPLSKDQEDANKAEWKDVIRWREQERGDVLLSLPIEAAKHALAQIPDAHHEDKAPADRPHLPEAARVIAHSMFSIEEIAPSPAGKEIVFETGPVSHRVENPADTEMYLVPESGGEPRQLTHNEGAEGDLEWNPAGKTIYFMVHAGAGSIEGPYQDEQGQIFSINPATGDPASAKITRLGGDFKGSWDSFSVAGDGTVLASGSTGIEQHLYRVHEAAFDEVGNVAGTYSHVDAAKHGGSLLFTHSTITDPTQVFVSASVTDAGSAKAITNLNPVFHERAQVEWQPYRWKSDDGTDVEGVLIYPPGKKDAKHLPMFTLIHGGPEDADGNHFGADWYDWATLAAAKGWLVFRPNYRGSTGYGDKFMQAIVPKLVSSPGRDILTGVDALVKEGIADPDHLTIGGYSYGGYMTNWLITQTTRFKAAVTGAGAVEHAANWGNDDLTRDDAWYLGGAPWEKPEMYASEAALFQMNKVTTPTHLVGGTADVRVAYLEDVLLERALQRLNVPHAFLALPGEGHGLGKNPWHGYIKVREELKWLEKYGNSRE